MAMNMDVSYTPYATSLKEQTSDIITFTHLEEGGLSYETHDTAESSDESDKNSIMPPLMRKQEIDAMDSGDESEDEPMSMEMLEDIRDGSQSHKIVNRRQSR